MKKRIPSRFHPGEYIRDEMKARDMSLTELTLAMKVSPQLLGLILKGECSVDRDIAKKLGQAFGMKPQVWLNLQRAYDKGVKK